MDNVPERVDRPQIKELDDILGERFDVLDDGFVRVVDYLGSDSSIVQAARVSYGKGTKKVSQDRDLIRYLLRHKHTTPFEMCELKLHVRVPMDSWRQWIRHRTANVNEYSTRYSMAIDSAYKTEPDDWRLQAKSNKQGSEGTLDISKGEDLTKGETDLHKLCRETYDRRIEYGIAREQARKDLPLSTYTEAYWKIDLHNLLHFLELRMEMNAQYEIRAYANVIAHEIVKKWVPITWEAFEDYNLGSLTFSQLELDMLSFIAKNDTAGACRHAEEKGLIRKKDDAFKPTFEGREFEEKLEQLGFKIPW